MPREWRGTRRNEGAYRIESSPPCSPQTVIVRSHCASLPLHKHYSTHHTYRTPLSSYAVYSDEH